mgnify:FL=1
MHPKDFFAEMWKTITTGNVWRNEICNKAKDGSLYWVDSTINPVKDENGKIYQYMSIRFLITDRKKVEYENQTLINQLIQQNNDLLRFSYIISHNLRAPVTNIMGLVDLIQLIIPQSTEQIKTALTHLNTSAHRLDEIIEDLNNLLNIKKKIGEKKETFLLSEIIDRVKQLLFAQIEESQAEIVIKLEEVNEVNSIKSYIESILFNLISNAIKFRNPSRSLYIEIYSKINDANLELVVKDNGLGMNLDRIKDKIFMLYNRFHPQIEGKGIGLFLTRTMVENLGGKMTAESNQNEGSIFRITIPIINLKV